MPTPLKISPRFAGQVELADYCPRCCWYALHIKHMPFEKGFPGIMFYLEQAEKAVILDHVKNHDKVPDYFKPFADCTEPVDFPFAMSAYHEESDVHLTARPDMMFRRANGNALMLDLKTSKPSGGGIKFRPQYEIQVIGYSWVAEAANVAKVDSAGLLYCEMLHEQIKNKPSDFATKAGFTAAFRFEMHPVELQYSRLTTCLREMKRLWDGDSPPRGSHGCKNCVLWNSIFNFELELRQSDNLLGRIRGLSDREIVTRNYYRDIASGTTQLFREVMETGLTTDEIGTVWHNWWEG